MPAMKILFASLAMDGHFNPLTGVAAHLRRQGHDVRWYTGRSYAQRLAKLGIPHAPYQRATEVNGENLSELYPEYESLGMGPKAIAFALEKIFFGNLQAQFEDIRDLHGEFPFTALVFDAAFYAARLVHEVLGVDAFPVWPAPTPAPTSSKNPPPFFGLTPRDGPFGWLRDRLVYKLHKSASAGGMRILAEVRTSLGLPPYVGSIFDIHNETSKVMFRWGSPSTDFAVMQWPPHAVFAGPLLPHKATSSELPAAVSSALARFGGSAVVVSQGTIDNRDAAKLFVPTLTALADTPHLVVATTGGRNTAELRAQFPHSNVVVEDYVDFGALLPVAKLLISNGGAGSVMHALVRGVPVVTAGKLEGKNDINVRLAERGLGVDLGTERPTPRAIARAVSKVLEDPSVRERAAEVSRELARYDSNTIVERAIVSGAIVNTLDPASSL